MILIDEHTFPEEINNVRNGDTDRVLLSYLLDNVYHEREQVHWLNTLNENELNNPVQVNSWILLYQPLQLLELRMQVVFACCVKYDLNLLLNFRRWSRQIRIFYNIFQLDSCVFWYSFL